MPRFVVDLGEMQMSEANEQELDKLIQKTVLNYIVDLDLEYIPPFGRKPHIINGMYPLDPHFAVDKVEFTKEFEQFARAPMTR